MARPKKYIINTKELEKLASYGCTVEECGEFFNCPPRVISQSYQEFYTKGFNSTKKRLRMAQLKSALSGNTVMLIWLGKQYLGQSDKESHDFSTGGKSFDKIQVSICK